MAWRGPYSEASEAGHSKQHIARPAKMARSDCHRGAPADDMEQYASRDGPSTVGNASHRSVRSRASAASGASRKSGKRVDASRVVRRCEGSV